MAEEEAPENPAAVWISPNAVLGYSMVFYGIVATVLSSLLPGFLEDITALGQFAGIIGIVNLVFVTIQYFNYFGFERNDIMGLAISLTFGFMFILVYSNAIVFKAIEEFSIDVRFRLSSLQLQSRDITKGAELRATNPEAHPALRVIGIDTGTVNWYGGWPFGWDKYANLLAALEGSKLNSVMFDIFFLDEGKNNHGVRTLVKKTGDKILRGTGNKAITITPAQIKKAKRFLSEEMERNGKVIVDYSFETSKLNEEAIDIREYRKRVKYLNKFQVVNIIPSDYDNELEWVDHPEPPISKIGKVLLSMGYANIRKQDTGVNRTLPIVLKHKNKMYPSIDLVLVAAYYGIDLRKDVEVKLGDYVKLKNIPDKKIRIGIMDEPADIMVKPNAKREVTIPIDNEGFMYINFIGGPWSFESLAFQDIADNPRGTFGENDPFENMILFVAMYYATGAGSAKDIHTSPFGDVAGIEHHVSAVNTILNQDFMHYAPDWANWMILILVSMAIGFVVPRYNIQYSLMFALVVAIVFAVEVFVVFNVFNLVHIFFTPYILMVVCLIGIIGYKVLTEEANVKYIRSTFSRFVSKDIVNELLANPDSMKLGGDKRELTVFFSDIRGFTTISEALSPEDLVSLLNEYLSEMTNIVLMYKGTIDKYMGDAIMAFWGAPVENPDHAYQASLCCLAQMRRLEELQADWSARGVPVINIGIGCNSGPAVVGNIGSSHRMEYTVMGDTINLGSRVESVNKQYGTHIIISEYTYEPIKDRVIARELDNIKVKGKTEPVRIYELMGVVKEEDFETHKVAEL